MMDPIIAKLNQQVTEKVRNSSVAPQEGEPSAFQQTLDNSFAERLLDKMKESFDVTPAQGELNALSADQIHVNTANAEIPTEGSQEKFFGMFKEMNRDLINLDATLEIMTHPGFKPKAHELIAFQAGIANTQIMAEGFSRFVDAVSRGINTVVNTQV